MKLRISARRDLESNALGCLVLASLFLVGSASCLRAAFLPGDVDLTFHPSIEARLAENLPGGRLAFFGTGRYGTNSADGVSQLVVLERDGTLVSGPWFLPQLVGSSDIVFSDLSAMPDGSFLLSGWSYDYFAFPPIRWSRTMLRRCLPGGSIDPKFGWNFDVDGKMHVTMALPDGCFLVGGTFAAPGIPTVFRFLPDGTLDPTFAMGRGVQGQGRPSVVLALASLSGGRILAGGDFKGLEDQSGKALARIFYAGEIDPDFKSPLGVGSSVRAIAVQPDGRILIAGLLKFGGRAPVGLARLLPDGADDPTFIHPSIALDPQIPPGGLGIDSQGNVVLSGYFDSVNGLPYGGLARFLPNGKLDPNFAAFDRTLVGRYLSYVLIDESDQIYSLQNRWINGVELGTPRLYGGSPAPFKPLILQPPSIRTITEGTEGAFGIAVAGFPAPTYQWLLNGELLPGITNQSFSIHSMRRAHQGVLSAIVSNPLGVVTQQVATILVKPVQHQLGANDPSFRLTDPAWNKFYSAAEDLEGQLFVAGKASLDGSERILLFDGYGQPIPSFAATLRGLSLPGRDVVNLAPMENGGVLVGGTFDRINDIPRRNLARLRPSGDLDPEFLDLGGASGAVTATLTLPGGGFFVAGDFKAIQGVAKERIAALNLNGRVDGGFSAPVFDEGAQIRKLLPLANSDAEGGVIVAGQWTSINGSARGGLVRLDRHGDVKPDFFSSVTATSVVAAAYSEGRTVAAWTEWVVPSVLTVLRRFMPDGTVDQTFQVPGRIQGEVSDVVVDRKGRVLISGPRSIAFDQFPVRQVLRFLPDGTLDTNFSAASSTPGPFPKSSHILFSLRDGRLASATDSQFNLRFSDVDDTSPPRLTASLSSSEALLGNPATLALPAEGENLKYTWFFNGQALGTSATGYSNPVVDSGDFGDYFVVVSNGFGAVTSTATRLQPGASPPVVVRNTTSIPIAFPGDDVLLRSTVSGSATLRLQWYRDRVAIPGQNQSTLLLPSVQTSDSAWYELVAQNPLGEAHSWPMEFHVLGECFVSEALDTPGLRWASDLPERWKSETHDSADGVDAIEIGPLAEPGTNWVQTRLPSPGTLKFSWKLNPTDSAHQFHFFLHSNPGFPNIVRLKFLRGTNWTDESVPVPAGLYATWMFGRRAGSNPSGVKGYLDQVRFEPTHASAPTITRQPEGSTLSPGGILRLSVSGEASLPFTFQWRKNHSDLPDETRPVLLISGVTESDSGAYSVVLRNVDGLVESQIAEVVVTALPTPISVPLLSTSRGVEFRWAYEPGRNYGLQASENLVDWFYPNGWVWPITGKVVEIVDPVGLTRPQRFYRRVLEP